MLPLPDGDGNIFCLSCNRRVKVAPTRPTSVKTTSTGPWTDVGADAAPSNPKGKRGKLLWAGLALFVGVRIAMLSVSADDDGPAESIQRFDVERVLPYATTDAGPSGRDGEAIVTVVHEQDGSEVRRRLARVRLGPIGATEQWRADLSLDTAVRTIEADETVFVTDDVQLHAVDVDTGTTRWSTALPDVVDPACSDCVSTAGDAVVVRTYDGSVTVWDGGSAEPAWSTDLSSEIDVLRVVGSRVLISQIVDGRLSMIARDVRSGTEVDRIDAPCDPSPTMPPHSISPIPGGDEVLLVFGYVDVCAIRWNPATGAAGDPVYLPEDLTLDRRAWTDPVFLGDEATITSSGALGLLDVRTGTFRSLEVPDDVDVVTAAAYDDVLIATTVSTRGTPTAGLAGWRITDGTLLWADDLPDRPVLLGQVHQDEWSVDVVDHGDSGIALAELDGAPQVLTITNRDEPTARSNGVDLDTGNLSGGATIDLEPGPYPNGPTDVTVVTTGPDRIVFVRDGVLLWLPGPGDDPIGTYPG